MSEEIDRQVAEQVMGWVIHPRDTANYVLPIWGEHFVKSYKFMASTCCSDRWAPSTNITHAWAVVAHMESVGWSFGIHNDHQPKPTNWPWGWVADFGDFCAEADTAPMAICLAALKAVKA